MKTRKKRAISTSRRAVSGPRQAASPPDGTAAGGGSPSLETKAPGTSASPEIATGLSRIAFGLVEVSEPGNAGAAARTLAAFGFQELLLIDPRRPPGVEDEALAVRWGRPVLDRALRVGTKEAESLLAGYDMIWGTTARAGRHRRLQTLESAAAEYRARPPGRLLVLFGRERDGLDRCWLDRCHRLVRIPTPGGPLNLAHAVAVVAYELTRPAAERPGRAQTAEPPAPLRDRREILRRVSAVLALLGYPSRSLRRHPPETYLEPLRSGPLSRRQAQWLLGLIRRLEQRLGQDPGRPRGKG